MFIPSAMMQIYIAYLGSLPDGDYIPTSHHFSLLQALFKHSSAENYLIRSYKRSFNGFAAKLTNEEAKKLASFKGVVSVFPNELNAILLPRAMWLSVVLDSGIWPESDSFSDEGFGPPPKKWKGSCKGGQNFTCNNKLIGARDYVGDSARDKQGHGTHTASTAAGNHIVNASSMDWKLKALQEEGQYWSFRAIGDECVAPWILTVAASTTDRFFIDRVVLGNGKTLTGLSVNSFSLNGTKVPLVYGLQASTGCDQISARLSCLIDCLNRTLVKNKIINISFVVPLPASALRADGFDSLQSYLKSTKHIFSNKPTVISRQLRVLLYFLLSFFSLNVMQPDISAPGVNIWLHFPLLPYLHQLQQTKGGVKYNILSGTSMSCPHVAGVAAYVKTFHPDWSPSAIKSALITTAPMDPSKNPNAEFGDNIRFLCSIGYSEDDIRTISGTNSSCPKNSNQTLPRDFNYPTLSALQSTYNATISSSPKLEVTVIPQVLSFKALKEKKSYNVTVKGKAFG
ncbi:hypothetical protein GQ457_15G029840 [Hibiscus cannabinus]